MATRTESFQVTGTDQGKQLHWDNLEPDDTMPCREQRWLHWFFFFKRGKSHLPKHTGTAQLALWQTEHWETETSGVKMWSAWKTWSQPGIALRWATAQVTCFLASLLCVEKWRDSPCPDSPSLFLSWLTCSSCFCIDLSIWIDGEMQSIQCWALFATLRLFFVVQAILDVNLEKGRARTGIPFLFFFLFLNLKAIWTKCHDYRVEKT